MAGSTLSRRPFRTLRTLVHLACALAALAGLPGAAAGQVDVQPLSREELPEGYSGSLTTNLTAQTGNTDFVQLGVNARVYNVVGRRTTMIVGNGGLGFLGRSRFSSSGLFHYRRTYRLSAWAWPEWYAQVNYDRSQLLVWRTVVGAGARTPVTTGSWGEAGAGFSLLVEDERLDLEAEALHPDHTLAVRGSAHFSLRLVPGQVVITSTTYAQPRVDDPGDIRLLQEMSVASPVTDRLALTVSFDLRYDSGPPDGLAPVDARLRTGLTLSY